MSRESTNSATSRGRAPTKGFPGSFPKIVITHFCLLIIFTSWAFGGQAPWVRQILAVWGTIGAGLFFVGCWREAKNKGWGSIFRYLWPLVLFDAMVGLSCLNPNFKEIATGGTSRLVMGDPIPWLPSTARPELSLRELWQFNVIILSCFNLFLAVSSRSLLRLVLFIMAGNAVVLAVFGTFQKLIHSSGLWFGLVPSPNPKFFATFIYHNHWGAFTLLNTAICLGLLFHTLRRTSGRDIWHSPVLMGVVITLLLAASIPLSASRSSTILMAGLLAGSLFYFLTRLIRLRRKRRESAFAPVLSIVLATLLATAAIGYLARDVIAQRTRLTTEQIAQITNEDKLNSRLTLYRDTWRMAEAKPWFGWGLESYAHVFRVFNSQRPVESWFEQPFYAEAHNDWFQSIAEVGFVGTGLLALLLGLPLAYIPWRRADSILPRYLLTGCAIILLYAWLEFPFANPAVMITFAASYYCALRYAELDQREPTAAENPV